MTTIAQAFVKLEPRVDSGFERRTQSTFGRVAGLAAKAFAVGFAAKQTFDFFADATKSAEAYASAQANTRQIIEKTGAAANVTQQDVAGLTKELQNRTGVDDKLIQSGSNILLTFKNIANEAGRGNDIFDRTNSIMLDLAEVTGTSAASAATQLGKALNDPVKGITALQRVGVSFTDQQKDQIAQLVESGDTLNAQKLILGELESQYGGTAEASADASAKIGNVFEDLKERVGAFLLPALESTATFLIDEALPAFDRGFAVLSDLFSDVARIVSKIFGAGGDLRESVGGDADFFRDTFERITNVVQAELELVRTIIEVVGRGIAAFWRTWGTTILSILRRVWTAVKEIVRSALVIVEGIIKTVTAVLQGDWRAAWEGVKQILRGAWDAIFAIVRLAAGVVRDLIAGAARRWLEQVRGFAVGVVDRFRSMRDTTVRTVRGWIDSVVGLFRDLPRRIAAAARDLARTVRERIADVISGIKINLPFGLSIGGDGLGIPGGAGGGRLRGIPESATVAQLYRSLGSPGDVISGSRPGARTLSGGISYHARDRALDFWPATRGMAEAMIALAGPLIKELITPWPDLGVLNGRRHRFSDPVQAQHDGRRGVKHFHLAMARGGFGTVTRPTEFLAGEAGDEDYVFAPRRDGGLRRLIGDTVAGRSVTVNVTTVDLPERVAAAVTRELAVADLVAGM